MAGLTVTCISESKRGRKSQTSAVTRLPKDLIGRVMAVRPERLHHSIYPTINDLDSEQQDDIESGSKFLGECRFTVPV